MTADQRQPGMCAARGCPLPATRGDACFCHAGRPPSSHEAITRELLERQAHVVDALLAIRRRGGSFTDCSESYRALQRGLVAAGRPELLLGSLDCSPYRPDRPLIASWLARLERTLIDATDSAAGQSRQVSAAPKKSPVIGPTRTVIARAYVD